MRKAIPLTRKEKKIILEYNKKLTIIQIADKIGQKSPFRVTQFLRKQGFIKRKKNLTDEQKKFVDMNWKRLTEPDLAEHLKVTRFYVQKYKREAGLTKYPANDRHKKQVAIVREGYFNVMAKANWMV